MEHKLEVNGFLKDLGHRVRTLRTAAGRSLQDLAGQAEISPRFLSDVEAGRGNISVARLCRVAEALERPIQTLLPGDKTDSSLLGRVWEMLESSTAEDLEELHSWLSERRQNPVPRSIALVGVRGAGKSTVGKKLARRLGMGFRELDAVIEEESGISLVELFTLHGEGYYRQLQHDVVERMLAKSSPMVLATGGSLVVDRETWGLVRRHCHTIWLKARPKDHWDRVVAQGDIRPMRNNPSAMDELKAMLKSREPLYAQAEITVDTSRNTPAESTALIVESLRKRARREDHPSTAARRPPPAGSR